MFFHIFTINLVLNLLAFNVHSEQFGPEGDYSIINEDVIGNEVKCLVCKASLEELLHKLKSVDPTKTEDVGGYKFDNDGNLKKKTVLQVQSEIFISDLMDEMCTTMENYVRARWKSTQELTLLRMFDLDGKMNTDISNVDLIQDEDLNKSLDFYCKSVFEEFEENVIRNIKEGTEDIITQVCTVESRLCRPKEKNGQTDKEEL